MSCYLVFFSPPDPIENKAWHVQWLAAIGQETKIGFSNGAKLESFTIQRLDILKLVCKRHFEADCFVEDDRLKVNALPTKFMHGDDEEHVQQVC